MHPFVRLLFALLLSRGVACASVDLGSPASFTPYDPYLRPVKEVLGSLSGEATSMDRVRQLMRQGRNFRYSFTDPYVAAPPIVTAMRKAGDCKAKSLWLCEQLGDEHVRYVIGKTRRNAKLSHAWVMWKFDGRWWILDCTNTARPIAADTVSKNVYIPLYSFDRTAAYRHASTQLITAGIVSKRSAVATKNHPRD